ncbi:glutathione S-transferase family protein [Croceicoccus mobilis]|uniref:Glutathione S-transferase n=1 Tax=Croceicoccus mobilis TaxID=1703339 RepID=A0A917DS49_9SPHN|nr:glutathione S-transferase family protein [Croceicoccus mobilis]GGD61459.1 glutathione S-transferase [Croceicoccus mobilis]
MKLIIGNKNYSSWSLRGWLAAKQSGLSFEEITVNISGEDWEEAKKSWGDVQPSSGKVPVLWDDEVVIWDSLAILEYLDDKVREEGGGKAGSRFWPKDPVARGLCRSMVAEMHSSYAALRSEMPMNVRRRMEGHALSDAAKTDIVRVLTLWAEARARFGAGGPFLFGSYSAADIFYAPVVSRFMTYGVGVPKFAETYMEAVWEHDWMQEWITAAEEEDWQIAAFEVPAD